MIEVSTCNISQMQKKSQIPCSLFTLIKTFFLQVFNQQI